MYTAFNDAFLILRQFPLGGLLELLVFWDFLLECV
jgi:hypothetical protein